MREVNSCVVSGRLVRDAELNYSKNGLAICRYAIANNYVGKNKEQEVNFFDVVQFGNFAESLAQYLKKGTRVVVTGELRQNRWENEQGEKRSKVELIAREVVLLGGKGEAREEQEDDSDEFTDDVPF